MLKKKCTLLLHATMLTTQYLYPPAGSCVACRSSMYSGAVYGALFAAKKGNMEASTLKRQTYPLSLSWKRMFLKSRSNL